MLKVVRVSEKFYGVRRNGLDGVGRRVHVIQIAPSSKSRRDEFFKTTSFMHSQI